jgi:hypothetical protein
MTGLLDQMQAAQRAAAARQMSHTPQRPVGGREMADAMQAVGLLAAPVPVVGDVVGLLGDAAMYAAKPEERTAGNALLTVLGALPMVPGAASAAAARKAAAQVMDHIPVRFAIDKALRPGERFTNVDKGIVTITGGSRGAFPIDRARLKDLLYEDLRYLTLPEYDHYFRFTNNKDEVALLRSGKLRPSTNWRDGVAERGLSVADGPHYSVNGYRYWYPITGDVVAYGSDGEPLLDLKTLNALADMPSPTRSIVKKDLADRAKNAAALGLPAQWRETPFKFLNDIEDVLEKAK